MNNLRKKSTIFLTPYSSNKKKTYSYWGLNRHFNLTCKDGSFERGSILQVDKINRKDNSIHVRYASPSSDKTVVDNIGYFISLPVIHPDSEYSVLKGEERILMSATDNDTYNQLGIVFVVFPANLNDYVIEFIVNDKEKVLVHYSVGRNSLFGRISAKLTPTDRRNKRWTDLYTKVVRVRRTAQYYKELAKIRQLIIDDGWEEVRSTLITKITKDFKKDFNEAKTSIANLGVELQSRLALSTLSLS